MPEADMMVSYARILLYATNLYPSLKRTVLVRR